MPELPEVNRARALIEERALGREIAEVNATDTYVTRPHVPGELSDALVGAQFTSADFIAPLKQRGVSISMDGRGRALDNVFIERLWRSLKYELIYPGDFANGADLFQALDRYFHFYNHQRPHQALRYRTPADLFPRRSVRKRSSP